ncbi:uncharacterized protein LOC141646005 [Silene latifolia]|uniref:uncharacterized protein LOC141646005 n=1 Tax=Silene latifolia TaxID=37657 RepID=UPI003D780691
MSEPSEEIANAMPAVPSQENPQPDPNYNFYLKMKPLRTLRRAIEALLDPTFKDDHGFGIVGVTNESLVISATNKDKNTTAALFLKSPGMIEFRNNAPPPPLLSVELWAPLDLISQGLPCNLDGDDDTVIISHVHGTNRLCFEFGTVPPTGYWVQIVEIHNATLFPYLMVLTATTVPVNDIREMIDCTLQTRDLVKIDWKPDFASFEIGSDNKWEYDYSQNEVREPTRLKNGDIYQAEFDWVYTSLMKKVCLLSDKVGVLFLAVPEQHVLFKFHMGEIADFKLIKKAVLEVRDMNTQAGDA